MEINEVDIDNPITEIIAPPDDLDVIMALPNAESSPEQTSDVKGKQVRNVMYTNQLEHLEKLGLPTDQEDLFQYFMETFNPEEIAIILHDKDINDNGEPSKPHYHIVMKFPRKKPIRIGTLANKIGDTPNNFDFRNPENESEKSSKNSWNSMISYLCHRTIKAFSKHQYEPDLVTANFDYPARLKEISVNMIIPRKIQIKSLLNAFGTPNEGVSLNDVKEELTPLEYAKHKRDIDIIFAENQDRHYEEFKQKMQESGEQIETYYLYGPTGTGKTRYAKERFNGDYYLTGSNRDPFSSYGADGTYPETIILDDLRPDTIPWNELLKLTDPFNYENVAGSRYYDKKLCSKIRIITTPFSPEQFYKKMRDLDEGADLANYSKNDSPEQFFRRITVFRFDKDYIYPQMYLAGGYEFHDINQIDTPHNEVLEDENMNELQKYVAKMEKQINDDYADRDEDNNKDKVRIPNEWTSVETFKTQTEVLSAVSKLFPVNKGDEEND